MLLVQLGGVVASDDSHVRIVFGLYVVQGVSIIMTDVCYL
jgi:hypothetical protein